MSVAPGTFLFETARLRVRRLRPDDYEPFHEMQASELVMRYTTGKPLSAETNREQLDHCIREYDSPRQNFLVWAVEQKENERFVGTCALVVNEKDENEIGYRFLASCFGRGFGQEIADGLIDFALGTFGCKSLVAYVDVRNTASVRILDQSRLPFDREELDAQSILVRRYSLDLESEASGRGT